MGYNATPARILYLPESYILCSIFVDVVFIVVYCLVFYRAFHVPVSTEAVSQGLVGLRLLHFHSLETTLCGLETCTKNECQQTMPICFFFFYKDTHLTSTFFCGCCFNAPVSPTLLLLPLMLSIYLSIIIPTYI